MVIVPELLVIALAELAKFTPQLACVPDATPVRAMFPLPVEVEIFPLLLTSIP